MQIQNSYQIIEIGVISIAIIILGLSLIYLYTYYTKRKSKITKYFGVIISLLTIFLCVGFYAYYTSPSELASNFSAVINESPVKILVTVLTITLSYLITIVFDILTERIVKEDGRQVVDEHRREVIFRIIQLIIYGIVLMLILNYWNINIRNILIGAGALAAIIGLSARHTLTATISGIILLFSRPYKVGDWIKVDEVEGTVKRITIINTIITTQEDEEVIIPNDIISEKTIKNKNKTDKLRLSIMVQTSYRNEIDKVLRTAANTITDCGIISDTPEPKSQIESFGESGINIRVDFWIKKPTPRREKVSKAVAYREIRKSFNEKNIEIPYPHRRLVTDKNQFDKLNSESQTGDKSIDKPVTKKET